MASVSNFPSDNSFITPSQDSEDDAPDVRDGLYATTPPEDLYADLDEDPYEYDEFLHKSGRFPSRMTSHRPSRRSISDSRDY